MRFTLQLYWGQADKVFALWRMLLQKLIPGGLHVSHRTVVLRVGMHSLSQVQAEL